MKLEKGQIVSIKYGTYHNPKRDFDREPHVRRGAFERMSAGDEFAVVRVNYLPWPFTHLHVPLEDIDVLDNESQT